MATTLEDKLWHALELVEDEFMNAGMSTGEMEPVVERWLESLRQGTRESDSNQ